MLILSIIINSLAIAFLAYFYEKRLEKLERKILEHDLAIHKRMKDL